MKVYGSSDGEEVDFDLETLEYERVVSFEFIDGQFVIREECDAYFFAELSKDEFKAFINALQNLYERSK